MTENDWRKVRQAVWEIEKRISCRSDLVLDIPGKKAIVYSCGANVIRIDINRVGGGD